MEACVYLEEEEGWGGVVGVNNRVVCSVGTYELSAGVEVVEVAVRLCFFLFFCCWWGGCFLVGGDIAPRLDDLDVGTWVCTCIGLLFPSGEVICSGSVSCCGGTGGGGSVVMVGVDVVVVRVGVDVVVMVEIEGDIFVVMVVDMDT